MRVCFLRHGPAGDPDDWKGADEDRPLTGHGRALVRDVGRSLADHGIGFDAVVTSPYARCAQTAAIVAEETGTVDVSPDDRLAPGFDVDDFGHLLSEHGEARSILLVGHEPDFSETVGTLVGGARLHVKRAAIACIDRPDPQSGDWTLELLAQPGVMKEP